VIKNRFHRMFLPSQSLDAVSPTDLLLCFEVLSPELAKERVVELQVQQRPQVTSIPITKCAACQKKQQSEEEKLKRCTRCYRVGYCNVVCQRTHWSNHKTLCRPENIGFPFLVSIPESRLTYARLVQLLEGYARYSVSVFQPPFQVGRVPSEQGLPLLSAEKQEPPVRNSCATVGSAAAATATVETSALEPGEGARAPHLLQEPQPSLSAPELQPELGDASTVRSKVPTGRNSDLSLDSGYAEPSAESQLEGCMERELPYERIPRPEAAILGYQHPAEGLSSQVTQFYINKIDATSKEQKLEDKENSVVLDMYCPKCKQHREASKQLMLWRLPNILIIQLKRFSFRSFIWRDKINDMVDFPVRSLDLSKFCIGQKDEQQLPMYDLYAVINHYGGIIGGHYTAYARLPSDKNSQRSDVGE
ncbi:ubiquitin carboxyl-terminal hydrolase 19-like, partial [Protobothrops mucrosquamatus]|uniref:ubiquitin carboxyl-terminal hydrolase 19-like n=1 Tax=Protobothrops mucrosquamatus TaxID=103944 RepID=UPI000775CD98